MTPYPGWRAYLARERENYRLGLSPIHPEDAYLLAFIRDYRRARGHSPSLRDIARKMGWASWNTAWLRVGRLNHSGWLDHEFNRERTLRLTAKGTAFLAEVL